jgi:3D (Asp-Asp-Asp) domain-containing protein
MTSEELTPLRQETPTERETTSEHVIIIADETTLKSAVYKTTEATLEVAIAAVTEVTTAPTETVEVTDITELDVTAAGFPEYTYIGKFASSGYCKCQKCCGKWAWYPTASGAIAVEGVTVGADWATIPAGAVIYIEGFGERIVQDKPAKWIIERYNGRILDLYYDCHDTAWAHGVQYVNVWVVK